MNLIVAADNKWGIGRDGGLLASIPTDMKYFREHTTGKVVVMGRKNRTPRVSAQIPPLRDGSP